jgi:hypothetical protein
MKNIITVHIFSIIVLKSPYKVLALNLGFKYFLMKIKKRVVGGAKFLIPVLHGGKCVEGASCFYSYLKIWL